MRRHAKASSVGSNSGRNPNLRSPRPGAFVVAFLLCLCSACLIPGSAFAIETRPSIEAFGADGTSSSTFGTPHALAFDQGNEHLYALSQAPGSRIHGFDASSPGTHIPLGGKFPLSVVEGGEFSDLAVDSGSHDFYYSSDGEGKLYGFDSTGNELAGNFPLSGFSFPCGAAVDPSGNIWIVEFGVPAIKEYDSSGNLVGSVDVSAQGIPCHIAFDSEANLYASFYGAGVWRYSAAGGYASATEVDSVTGLSNPIAVDRSSDDLYVTHVNRVSVFDSSGAFLYEFGRDVTGANYTGIAIDQASDEVYLSDVGNGVVQIFGPVVSLPNVVTENADAITTTAATLHGRVNPEGLQLTGCQLEYVTEAAFKSTGFSDLSSGGSATCVPAAASIPPDSSGHAVSADVSGLAPGTTYRFRLVGTNVEGAGRALDRTFTTAIGPPVVSAQSVEAVGASDASLSAKINPKGAGTTYHVEYGTTAAYGNSTPESAPIGFASDDSDHLVSVHIGDLAPGTEYHFRFVATSPVGSAQGPDISFVTYQPPPAFGSCPNDRFRSGVGARLPDCRAYEQATPIDKHGANAQGTIKLIQASSAGDRVTFFTNGGLPTTGGSSSLYPFMASRGPAGWSSDGLMPLTDPGFDATVVGWNDDLSATAVIAPGPDNVGRAVYLRDSDSGAYQLGPTSSGQFAFANLAGFAGDTSHLIFESASNFLPSAPAGKNNLYDLDHDTLTLASRIPQGSATSCDDANGPACAPAPEGAFAGPYNWRESNINSFGGAEGRYYTKNTISRDGSRVFFTAAGSGQLYVRENGTATTQISASQRTVPDPDGPRPAAFMAATPDGSKVFFTSCEKLTDDSTASSTAENACTSDSGAQGQDLYSYDLDSDELTDLTVDSNVGDPKGAAVQGVLGISENGSYVYFAANGVLAPGASSGNCTIGFFGGGDCNLYVSHDGDITFIAPVEGDEDADGHNWAGQAPSADQKSSRVAADGRTLLFGSAQSLTGYDNGSGACAGSVCRELFRYSAPAEELICVSCNPTKAPPSGEASLGTNDKIGLTGGLHFTFLSRNLSADGNRVFFDSPDALVPADTNGVLDVYEWEAEGSGSCATAGGCVYLLSGGSGQDPSHFADASASGDHAFFFSDQQLVPSDRDQLYDIYDAGVGAGLPSQHALAPPTCTNTACQSNPAPPPEQTAASAVFSGSGNARRRSAARKCPKGKRKVRHAGKVRCQSTRKQHKRHSNRGGSK